MYKGFNLKLQKDLSSINQIYENIRDSYEDGRKINEYNKSCIQTELDKYLRGDNKLDGNSIKETWFPQVKADVFISHSHRDEEKAISLAGWLYTNFGLNCFIDSLVWDYAPKLIDQFNDTYNEIGNNPPRKTYGYQTAKYISSHIDLMLSTALNNMIDHCEALIFLNMPLSTGKAIENNKLDINKVEIESPWIYSELETSRIVREKLGRTRQKMKLYNSSGAIATKSLYESSLPPIVYDTDIKHLYKLTKENLEEWREIYIIENTKKHYSNPFQNPLDILYSLMKNEDLNM